MPDELWPRHQLLIYRDDIVYICDLYWVQLMPSLKQALATGPTSSEPVVVGVVSFLDSASSIEERLKFVYGISRLFPNFRPGAPGTKAQL